MKDVTLLKGMFYDSQMKGKEYLLFLDVDRLLAPCYEAVSQTPKKPRYGGWEAKEIAGHSIGHWLSAASAMYQASGDEKLKRKAEYAVNELSHIQQFDEEGYISGFSRRVLMRCSAVIFGWTTLVWEVLGCRGTASINCLRD